MLKMLLHGSDLHATACGVRGTFMCWPWLQGVAHFLRMRSVRCCRSYRLILV